MVVFGLEIVSMILDLMSLLSGEMSSQLRTMSRSTPEAVLAFKLKLPVPFRFMSNGQYFDGVGFLGGEIKGDMDHSPCTDILR